MSAKKPAHLLTSVLLIVLLALDNLTAPYPLTKIDIPPVYAELGQDSERYAIFEVPTFWCTRAQYLLYQTVHAKPMIGGYLSRDLHDPLLASIPLMRQLAYAEPVYDIIDQEPTQIAASVMSYFHIRYVFVHSDCGGARQELEQIAYAAAGNQKARRFSIPGRTFLMYTVAKPEQPQAFLGLGAGWPAAEIDSAGDAQRRLDQAADVIIYSAAPLSGTLALDLMSAQASSLELTIGDQQQHYALQKGAAQIEIALQLPAGEHHIHLDPAAAGHIVVRGIGLHTK